MRLLVSGEGPSDIGACKNAQGKCSDDDFLPGPMTIWLQRLWAASLNYDLLTIQESVIFVSENALAQAAKQGGGRMQALRGRNKAAETGWYYSNAKQLGLMAKALKTSDGSPVMAVLFRDTDGTCSAPGQLWQTKWQSMRDGFSAAEFDFGVPMLPKPKSEAWLLCANSQDHHSHAALENISGNDNAPNSAKHQLDQELGGHKSAADLARWCEDHPPDWDRLKTMPSFQAFFDRFSTVAQSILWPAVVQS